MRRGACAAAVLAACACLAAAPGYLSAKSNLASVLIDVGRSFRLSASQQFGKILLEI